MEAVRYLSPPDGAGANLHPHARVAREPGGVYRNHLLKIQPVPEAPKKSYFLYPEDIRFVVEVESP